jgi:hypothetical protein
MPSPMNASTMRTRMLRSFPVSFDISNTETRRHFVL